MAIITLSDLHLGEESSVANTDLGAILTSLRTDIPDIDTFVNKRLKKPEKDPVIAPENLTVQTLNDVLARISAKSPISHLILLGDILDLSVASYYDAAFQAQKFMSEMLHGISPKRIILIPGNHDHHLWAQVSEEQWIESALRQADLWRSPFCRTTEPSDPLDSRQPGVQFIKGFFPVHCRDRVEVAYPNYVTRGPDGGTYVFDHGHLFDYAQSWIGQWGPGKLIDVQTLADLERANSPWLEMVWYGFGQGGPLALDSENLYEEAQRFIDKLEVAKNILSGKLPAKAVEKAAREMLELGKRIWGWIKQGKSRNVNTPSRVSRARAKSQGELELGMNLRNYLAKFLTRANDYPASSTFVYGHTHSWCDRKNFHGRRVLNTGGWLAESDDGSPQRKGKMQTRVLVVKGNGPRFEVIPVDKKVYRFCWAMNKAVRDAVKSIAKLL
ncbi:MAG: metallophosphoesterase [Thermodesulfobacteriota bacterium]